MKITRLALEEFRQFRTPLVLDGLTDGLNIFVGPNEAGKSTVAAALRAAFLERFKTKMVSDLAPWGLAQPRPSIDVDFEQAGSTYRLRKTFLNRARCELTIDGERRLEGEAAEDALAQLLGYELPLKGQSKTEHGGIPGLLWIQQGSSQSITDVAAYASQHLRDALTRISGELTASDGDRLFESVAAARGALRDARTGRPKGLYREAEEQWEQAGLRVAQLQQDRAALDRDVDQLAQWRQSQARRAAEQPWAQFEQQAAAAREQLAQTETLRQRVEALVRDTETLRQRQALVQERMQRDHRDRTERDTLRVQSDDAAVAIEGVRQAAAQADAVQRQAADAALRARAERDAVHRRAAQRELLARRERATALTLQVTAQHRQATVLHTQLAALQAEPVGPAIAQGDIDALQALEQSLSTWAAQMGALAPKLTYRLTAGAPVTIGGAVVSGEGEYAVASATDIAVDGVGVFHIVPGGADLDALRGKVIDAQRRRQSLLDRMGVDHASAAQSAWLRQSNRTQDIALARRALAIHAPNGIDALTHDLTAAQTAQAEYDRQWAAIVAERAAASPVVARDGELAFDGSASPPAVAQREDASSDADDATLLARSEAAEKQLDAARQDAARAAGNVESAVARAEWARRQWRAACDALDHPDRVREREQDAVHASEADAQWQAATQQLAGAQAELAARQPELLAQDVRRFEQSARIAREEHDAQRERILQLQGRLEQAGAQGVGEALAAATAEVERLARRRDELARRARALDLLSELLGAQREAATRRLQAPLARRLNHYLGLWSPGAAIRLDDQLMPATLVRGEASDALRSLSFGTQEQLGILARLAYADLLAEAGRPTLLVLDDALVHTDDARRPLMKRALFDAATRHQILMFTCHAEAWQDMGAAQRVLSAHV
ncbi:AAA family ATPase [Alcaligenaceae bacterium C4P045]|nr:AAA family ATPase [Alcaligenaceae bacterium C4P045]